jgi:pyruvate formate-lyase activating enzyme-like uncharacterized protein
MVTDRRRGGARALPAVLRDVLEETSRAGLCRSNVERLRPTWSEHVRRARGFVPEVRVEADGEALYLGELSPGCRACKDGVWDCVFTTMRCNLDCDFCYSPHAIPDGYSGSAFGRTPGEVVANHAKTEIRGIGFSGGEPFLDPTCLLEWVAGLASGRPDAYYWVYTNGLLVTDEILCRLHELGIDEIRFNAAATGYDHPTVLENMRRAARHIRNVTVEIPAIPRDVERVLASLSIWSDLGVSYLNLHELIYEPGSNSASLEGPRQSFTTEDGHHCSFDPGSREISLVVMTRVKCLGLPLSVNDCSVQSKLRQLRGRRRSVAPLVKKKHERLIEDSLYESLCAYTDDEVIFFHPEAADAMRQQYPGRTYARLVRTAPLSLEDRGRWVAFDLL